MFCAPVTWLVFMDVYSLCLRVGLRGFTSLVGYDCWVCLVDAVDWLFSVGVGLVSMVCWLVFFGLL